MGFFIIYLIISFLIIISIYLYLQNNWYQQTSYHINSNKLTQPLNLVHLSDLHGKKINEAFIKIIKKSNSNLILITGDGIDSYRGGMDNLLHTCSILSTIAPVYYILGNHESRLNNINEFINSIENTGVIVLRNKGKYLQNLNINIIGINDPAFRNYYTTTKPFYVSSIYNNEIKKLNSTKFNLLLCHRPELLELYCTLGVDLALCGHGHGGQFRLPFLGGLYTPSEGFFPKFTSGLHMVNSTNMIISRGIGNSAFPFRINNRPEIIIIKLSSTNLK